MNKKMVMKIVFLILCVLAFLIIYKLNKYKYILNIKSLDYIQTSKTRNPKTGDVPSFEKEELQYFKEIEQYVINNSIYCKKNLSCKMGEYNFKLTESDYELVPLRDFIFDRSNNLLLFSNYDFKVKESYLIKGIDGKLIVENNPKVWLSEYNEIDYLIYMNPVYNDYNASFYYFSYELI